MKRRPLSSPLLRCCAITALLGAVAALPACGHKRATVVNTAKQETARPAVRGADSGLEMWWWVVTDAWRPPPAELLQSAPDEQAPPAAPPAPPPKKKAPGPADSYTGHPTDGPPLVFDGKKWRAAGALQTVELRDDKTDLEKALTPYLDRPVPLTEEQAARWRAAGLRMVAVPIADLDRLQSSLRLVGGVQQQWLGELPAWTDIVRGRAEEAPTVVATDDGVAKLEPGRLRLLARCWMAPLTGPSGEPAPVLRLEMIPEHQPDRPEPVRMLQAAGLGAGDGDVLFRRLAVAVSVGAGDAYLIIPEKPAAEWRSESKDAGPEATGPDAAPPPTLGEAMLSSPARNGSARARAVIVLIPRVPDRFELLR